MRPFNKDRITEQVNFRHRENIANPKKQSMTTRQTALINHAAAIPVDGDQWRRRMVLWMREQQMNPLSVEVLDNLPDEDDDYREARR